MADLFENPMGLDGFEFVEFASPQRGVLESIFEMLGFSLVANHRSKDVALYRQGEINFVINNEPGSLAAFFAEEHGPSACGLAFRVRDSHKAYARALELEEADDGFEDFEPAETDLEEGAFEPGIVDVYSLSEEVSLDGTPYSEW